MSKFVEQRICIKFRLQNQFSAADSLRTVQKAFGDEAMSKKMFRSDIMRSKQAVHMSNTKSLETVNLNRQSSRPKK